MKYVFILLAALLVGMIGSNTVLATPPSKSKTAHSLLPIRSETDLQRYLRETPPGKSPLDLLPRGAKKRFLGTLVFGRHGLGGFTGEDLQANLTDAQIHQVLNLFGSEALSYAKLMHGRDRPPTPAERTAPESPLELKFDKFYLASAHVKPQQIESITLSSYNALFSDAQQAGELKKLDDHDLELLYRAADSTVFWSKASRYLDDMRHDLDELQQRGLATDRRIAEFHQQLISARRFTEANALAAAHPTADLETLPPVQQVGTISGNEPTLLHLSTDGKHLWHQSVDIDAPLKIVVVASCHFSQDAAQAVSKDPTLNRLFHQHAIWLAPENAMLTDTLDWNRKFPDQPIEIAWQDSQWPMLDSWAMPTFYVFKHGKLVEEWTGWPDDSTALQTMQAKLQAAGVLNKDSKGS